MSTELDTPFTVVSPKTGEVLTLDAPTEDLAGWVADVRDWEAQAKDAKRIVQDELLSRLDKRAKWSQEFPETGLKITAPSSAPDESWDGAALRSRLLELVDTGALSIEAVDSAVEVEVTYKVKKAGVNALRKVGGQVEAVVSELRVTSDRTRSVTVSR